MSKAESGNPASGVYRFPDGFLWGASTASHQVEGDNRWNDWWEFEQSGRLPHQSLDACRHFELYESDFDLACSWNHNGHRLSIEWSRVEPEEGCWNQAAVDHYVQVLSALRQRGLEPVVTLHHFTSPAWFARRGGWVRADSVDLFRRYVEFIAPRLAPLARFWLTINEPTVYIKRAYVAGDWPPCQPRSWLHACRALRNLCRAHNAAYPILHHHRPDAMVGFAHSAPYVVACNPRHYGDRFAAWMRDLVLNETCFRLLGWTPQRHLDFIGINYYARQVVRWRPTALGVLFGTECRADHHAEPRHFSALGWEICPAGLRQVLHRFSRFGVPLMVTENGIATANERERTEFLIAHAQELAAAIRDGTHVLGYFYWTLIDNFEWTEGRSALFGLARTDFTSQERTARPAALAFARICGANAIAAGEAD